MSWKQMGLVICCTRKACSGTSYQDIIHQTKLLLIRWTGVFFPAFEMLTLLSKSKVLGNALRLSSSVKGQQLSYINITAGQ